MKREKHPSNPLGSLIEEWSDQFEKFLRDIGASPYLGLIISFFLLEDRPITQEELADRLQVSQATVSRCLKILNEKWKIISRVRVPDTRKWHYVNRKNTHIGIIISVMVSLLDAFRTHNIAFDGILSQFNALDQEIRETDDGIKFKALLDDMNQSTTLIGEELTKLVKNIQDQS